MSRRSLGGFAAAYKSSDDLDFLIRLCLSGPKTEVNTKLEALKSAAKGSDANALRRQMDEFNEALQKIGQHIYQGAGAGGGGGLGAGAGGRLGERVVEAERDPK